MEIGRLIVCKSFHGLCASVYSKNFRKEPCYQSGVDNCILSRSRVDIKLWRDRDKVNATTAMAKTPAVIYSQLNETLQLNQMILPAQFTLVCTVHLDERGVHKIC